MAFCMAADGGDALVGGQQGDGCAAPVAEDERVVAEAVAMIVHVAAQEEERGVAGSGDGTVPQLTVGRSISP